MERCKQRGIKPIANEIEQLTRAHQNFSRGAQAQGQALIRWSQFETHGFGTQATLYDAQLDAEIEPSAGDV